MSEEELVIKNIAHLVTEVGDPIQRGMDVRIRGNRIHKIREKGASSRNPDQTIDGTNLLVMPGLVNTHHHFFQTLNRCLPAVQNAGLFEWLDYLYGIWKFLTPEMSGISSKIAACELVRSGCTTSVDHFFVFPDQHKEGIFEAIIQGVREVGLRFHPVRGCTTISTDEGGLAPPNIVQDEQTVLSHTRRMIERHHDPKPLSMVRMGIGPASYFAVSDELMRTLRDLGKRHENLLLHTHLAETEDEIRSCLEATGNRPVQHLKELGWLNKRSLFAHGVHVNESEIRELSRTGAGISHCPSSNMRLGSGLAPVVDMRQAGVNVGIGVDGSASNDSSHLMAELRQALLSQRIRYDSTSVSPVDILQAGTAGGARSLGREDIGTLEPGQAADLIGIDLRRLDVAGSLHDPLASLVLCNPPTVDLSIINGEVVRKDGEFTSLDPQSLVAKQNELAQKQLERFEREKR